MSSQGSPVLRTLRVIKKPAPKSQNQRSSCVARAIPTVAIQNLLKGTSLPESRGPAGTRLTGEMEVSVRPPGLGVRNPASRFF